jgi:hypothetical protein
MRVENTSMGRSVAALDPVPDDTLCADDPAQACGEDVNGQIE